MAFRRSFGSWLDWSIPIVCVGVVFWLVGDYVWKEIQKAQRKVAVARAMRFKEIKHDPPVSGNALHIVFQKPVNLMSVSGSHIAYANKKMTPVILDENDNNGGAIGPPVTANVDGEFLIHPEPARYPLSAGRGITVVYDAPASLGFSQAENVSIQYADQEGNLHVEGVGGRPLNRSGTIITIEE